ncbi:hypothetical protein AYI68_g3281 [Smittium mucronatum]|uniref:Uncharacterized protein n=1 Tax=Smittium mucronatum TaxID=133383 RepID=A0A1R0H0D4_9FUNG|nr:hypothetical protein AYI68_g3281 [Smittium mucronatum]
MSSAASSSLPTSNTEDDYVPSIELVKCASLLTRKTTDDEKIAGLMVLPYLLSKDSELHPTGPYKYVFARFDWKFVKRLLLTGSSKLNSANSAEIVEQATSYISLSLHIIATFVCLDIFSSDHRLVALAPAICKAGSLGYFFLSTDLFAQI